MAKLCLSQAWLPTKMQSCSQISTPKQHKISLCLTDNQFIWCKELSCEIDRPAQLLRKSKPDWSKIAVLNMARSSCRVGWVHHDQISGNKTVNGATDTGECLLLPLLYLTTTPNAVLNAIPLSLIPESSLGCHTIYVHLVKAVGVGLRED